MKKLCLIVSCLLLLPLLLLAQEVEVKRERSFTGAGLYGFMNGGADQFMEYDVMSLVTRDVVYKGENYTIEIYEMPTPADAFGIYSIHVFKCQRADVAGCIDCLSPYQLQAAVGNQYVSVVFSSGSAAAQAGADELIRKYVPMKGDGQSVVPEMIRSKAPFSGVVKYLRGPLSVSTASRGLSLLLKDQRYTGVWLVKNKETDAYHALIYLPDEARLNALNAQLSAGQLLQSGSDFLYITGQEIEEEVQDNGPFGF